jgi:hypothetical protein
MTTGGTLDNGQNTTLTVKCDDNGLALIKAHGDSQGTGALEVGQSTTYGGGISYNGDGSPSFVTGESADHVTFYRLSAGTRSEVFHYPHNSSVVNFNSTPTVGASPIWHGGNDGSGSGLDADTVDGLQASAFTRNDAVANLDMNNHNITHVNHLTFNDSGANEGLQWLGGSDWRIFESPDNLTNASGNLQFVTGSTRRFGVTTAGYIGATRIYSAVDRSSGYFYNDTSTRTAYAGGDFYLQTSVGNYYNYATNIYLGNTSGDTVRFRGNTVTHNGFSFDSDGDMTTSRDIVSSARDKGVFGTYNSTQTDQIWSMGTAYRNHSSGTNFGNLYGLAYKHTNNSTGGTMASGHQMVWCQNGSPKAALGTNIWTSGNVTAYSDIRVKENIELIPNALDKVCTLNGYTFDRTDVTFDEHGVAETPVRQTGVIAQEVLEVLPEAVIGDEEGHYSVAYGNMVGLLIESIKELKAEVDDLKAQLESK